MIRGCTSNQLLYMITGKNTNKDYEEDELSRKLRLKTLSYYDFDEDKSGLLSGQTARNSDGSLMGFTDPGDIENQNVQKYHNEDDDSSEY